MGTQIESMDAEFVKIESDGVRAVASHLGRILELDKQIRVELEAQAADQRRIENMAALANNHAGLARNTLDFVRREISGSDRCWNLLETRVYGHAFPSVNVPESGTELETSALATASQEVIALRQAIDTPMFSVPGRLKRRLVELLRYLEGVRHGSEESAEALRARLKEDNQRLRERRDRAQRDHDQRVTDLRAQRDRELLEIEHRQELLAQSLPVPTAGHLGSGWDRAGELSFDDVAREIQPIILGGLHGTADDANHIPEDLRSAQIRWVRDVRVLGNLVLPYSTDAGRDLVDGHIENLVLNALGAFPPGQLRLAFIDPLGLGRADSAFLPLGDHNPDLIHRKVRSSREDIEDLLRALVADIERITQRYLRGSCSSIDEYNTAAEEIAEPYRLLVIHDYPEQFERGTSLHLLRRILENGPRCGIHTVITARADAGGDYEPGYADVMVGDIVEYYGDADIGGLPEGAHSTLLSLPSFDEEFGPENSSAIVSPFVDRVGRCAHESGVTTSIERALALYGRAVAGGNRKEIPTGTVSAELDDQTTWWRNSSAEALVAPVGPSSARDAAVIALDSRSTSSALLIGRPGSGKSTLLHTWLSTLTLLYSPQEVELLLVDFKEGVEFSAYARYGLPHASCIAIESEREFGLSILQEIEGRIKERSEAFKRAGAGVTSLEAYRAATGETMPRVVLVFDEFQVLFGHDDRIGLAAGQVLEKIIRQGRGFGIHVFLGSQSLSGMIALNRQAMQMISTRILLPCTADDAALALGEHSTAHRSLSARGEGVMTNDPNNAEATRPFRVAYEPDSEREKRVVELRRRADEAGFTRRPVVFSSDRAVRREAIVEVSEASPALGLSDIPRLRPGASVSMAPPPLIELSREPGRNVLALLREGPEAETAFTVGVIDDVLSSDPTAQVHVLPLAQTDELDGYLEPLADEERVRVLSRRALATTLSALRATVDQRLDSGSSIDPAVVLLLHGLHRARDLDPESGSGFSFDGPSEESAHDDLAHVLAHGPDVSVHVVAWADSLGGLQRRLSRSAAADFEIRLAGSLSAADAAEFLDHGVGGQLKPHQLVLHDQDSGRTEKLLLARAPALEWWRERVIVRATGADGVSTTGGKG